MRLESEIRKVLATFRAALDNESPGSDLITFTGLYSAIFILEWILEERQTVVDGFRYKCKELESILIRKGILSKVETDW